MVHQRACKYCGERAVLRKGGGTKAGQFYVRCKNFNCFSERGGGVVGLTFYPTKEAAAAAWNQQQECLTTNSR